MFRDIVRSTSLVLLGCVCPFAQSADNLGGPQHGLSGHPVGEGTAINLFLNSLPTATDYREFGKPTSATPQFLPPVAIDWVITERKVDRFGDRKQSQVVPRTVASQTVGTPTESVSTVATQTAATQVQVDAGAGVQSVEDAGSKPSCSAPPRFSEIATVTWSASRQSVSGVKAAGHTAGFHAAACPRVRIVGNRFVELDSDRHQAAPNAVVNAPSASPEQLNDAQFTSLSESRSVNIHQPYINDLKSLTDIPSAPATIADTYLEDLQSLVQGPSAWLFTNGVLLDLGQEDSDSADTFVDELKSLKPVDRSSSRNEKQPRPIRPTSNPRYWDESKFVPPSERGVFELAPEVDCEVVGTDQLMNKFRPLNSIRLSGGSTSPPQTQTGSKNEILSRPENLACAYLESASPAFYHTPTQFGVRRPNRTPQQFCHNPLYFEDANLERCGQSNGCLTTAVSAVHFGTMIALTPYLTATTHPNTCVKALPECPTCQQFGPEAYFPGWSWRGAAAQAGVVTGWVFLIP